MLYPYQARVGQVQLHRLQRSVCARHIRVDLHQGRRLLCAPIPDGAYAAVTCLHVCQDDAVHSMRSSQHAGAHLLQPRIVCRPDVGAAGAAGNAQQRMRVGLLRRAVGRCAAGALLPGPPGLRVHMPS
jgi:hypothetical protein